MLSLILVAQIVGLRDRPYTQNPGIDYQYCHYHYNNVKQTLLVGSPYLMTIAIINRLRVHFGVQISKAYKAASQRAM